MKKLTRSKNSKIGGVCSGISDYLEIDPIIIRLLFFALLFSTTPIVLIYIILWILLPSEK